MLYFKKSLRFVHRNTAIKSGASRNTYIYTYVWNILRFGIISAELKKAGIEYYSQIPNFSHWFLITFIFHIQVLFLMISYMISPDLNPIRTRSEPDLNPIWTRSEPNLNPIWTRSRPKYINLAKWVTKRNVTRYLVAFWQKIIIKCQIRHFGSLVMLYRAPKLQDFHSVARFGPGYPQKCQFWLFYQFLAKSKIWKRFSQSCQI